MKERDKSGWGIWAIGGIISFIFSVHFPDSLYKDDVVNMGVNSSVDGKDRAFNLFLHFISKYWGKVGVQVFFGVIAIIFFYTAYYKYIKDNRNQ